MKRVLRIYPAIAVALTAIASLASADAAPADGLEGQWTAEQANSERTTPIKATLVFTQTGGGLGGIMRVGADEMPLFDVKENGTSLSFTLVIPGTPYVSVHYAGARAGDEIRLASSEEGHGVFTMTAHRDGQTQTASLQPALPPAIPAPRVATILPDPAPALPRQSEPPVALLSPPPPPPVALPAPPRVPPPVPMVAAPSVPSTGLPPLRDVPPNNLAKTPPMGWASRQKLGTDIEDDVIRQAAEGLDETGLRAAGYVTVEIDDGWQGTRDANGALRGNEKFPDMKALGDYIHSKRLKFGLQTSAAPKSCGGFEGSYGHEAEDAKTFAAWGVDYLIYDGCGADAIYSTQAEQRAAYQKMGEALRASGREIAFGISQNGAFDVAQWGAKTGANLWRTGRDIEADWQSVTAAGFAQNGKESFAGPGRWNDPGLLQIGNGAMTPDEYRMHLNLWTVLAAPLMLGNDVRIMTRETLSALTNEEIIAVDQDALGKQGKRVSQNGTTEVWARPLADGSTAAAFFNRGDQSAAVAVSWQQLGIDGPRRMRDLWWHQNLGTANGRYVVFLTPHTSLLLKMSP